MKLIGFLIILFSFSACMNQAPPNRSNRLDAFSSNENPFTNPNGTNLNNNAPNFIHQLAWFSNNQYITEEINLFPDHSAHVFLRGSRVHEYLNQTNNFKNHCLLITFNTPNGLKYLSLKATPINLNNFLTGTLERTFRLSFSDFNGNKNSCLSSNEMVDYRLSDICPTCSNFIKGNVEGLFQSESFKDEFNQTKWRIGPVISTTMNIKSLKTQLNFNNTTGGNITACSNTQCKAQNFDCCLENQCVKNGGVRQSAVNQNPDEFDTIAQVVALNPSLYLNYPEFYYICPSSTSTNPDHNNSTPPTENQQLSQLVKDYYCIEEMKLLSESEPFHFEPINEEEDYEYCEIDDEDDPTYYLNVLKRLYDNCGCASGNLEDRIENCPNYTYKVNATDAQNNPIDISCFTPPVVVETPFQNLSTVLNARTAPHRFFEAESGEAIDDLSTTPNVQMLQAEGEVFTYLDNEKTMPVNGEFNMNSIIGQMSTLLNQALPAKMIKVKYDDVYLIATTSGFYTPCPTCARDSWYNPFSAHPSSQRGTGVQPFAYTTERDSYGFNLSQANYEDMIFGRACFLPPTMIPFSHAPLDEVTEQRQNRLMTQAALYANGYQRDWFGFNKGAVIGSFDGVTWFAIGKGRVVKASSDKLFLAINAPFADLADPSNHVVSVQQFDGISTAPQFDYNPNLAPDHAFQNEAATCQNYHSCEVDSDCITQLGWEYVCADVNQIKTSWPLFDSEANEIEGEYQNLRIEQILQQAQLPSGSQKRCVYRGAGAPCRLNAENGANNELKKISSCAPNFYCATFDSEVFNHEVARYNGALENLPFERNHLFGQDANMLGRPRHYISNELNEMPDNIAATISFAKSMMDEEAEDDTGVCRPGRATVADTDELNEQQRTPSSELTTDYISQIGGCEAENPDLNKYFACPVLNASGDYLRFNNNFISSYENDPDSAFEQYVIRAARQNSCGRESVTEDGESSFAYIEAPNLNDDEFTVVEKTLVQNACLRRAGAVCHTDLDCSPNKMHAEESLNFPADYFGNEAERRYWEEYLVCGQAQAKPSPFDIDFKNYKINENRCCREVGKDLSIYSEKTPGVAESFNVSTTMYSAINPDEPDRYSRFTIADDMIAVSGSAEVVGGELVDDDNLLNPNQWKPVSQVAQKTCCGGGWIRKFADGSNDWLNNARLNLDVTNFRCLNFKSPLVNTPDPTQYNIQNAWLSRDYNLFCSGNGTTGQNGCMETGMSTTATNFTPVAPTLDNTTTITVRTDDKFKGGPFAPFAPLATDGEVTIFDHTNGPGDRKRGYEVPLIIPAYMDYTQITQVRIRNKTTEAVWNSCNIVQNTCSDFSSLSNSCEACINTSQGSMKVIQNNLPGDIDWYIDITFRPPGSNSYNAANRSANAGNYYYYLEKLARLELIGIPQIYYEPISCNDNHQNLVPGILKDAIKTYNQFQNDNATFDAASVLNKSYNNTDPTNPNKLATSSQGLGHDKVFSANEFKCCLKLGSKTSNKNLCCSGYAVNVGQNLTCKLPVAADLNVYFNRFVSSDGSGEDAPGGGLTDTDFHPNTGEPKLNNSVLQKLNALGQAYCESGKTRRGSAFGTFESEPKSGFGGTSGATSFSIVDSFTDRGQSLSSGGDGSSQEVSYQVFAEGFRWNHHIYCAP